MTPLYCFKISPRFCLFEKLLSATHQAIYLKCLLKLPSDLSDNGVRKYRAGENKGDNTHLSVSSQWTPLAWIGKTASRSEQLYIIILTIKVNCGKILATLAFHLLIELTYKPHCKAWLHPARWMSPKWSQYTRRARYFCPLVISDTGSFDWHVTTFPT